MSYTCIFSIKEIHEGKFDENSSLIWKTSDGIRVLDFEDLKAFDYEDFTSKKCSDNRTLFHLACESGEFKLINHCFSAISRQQFEELIQIRTRDGKTAAQLAEEEFFDQKLNIFKSLHDRTDDANNKNTLIHQLVIHNQTKELRNLLEYLYFNRLLDTVGFGLKNKEGKTAIDIAIQNKNSEAIYLLIDFESKKTPLKYEKLPLVGNKIDNDENDTYI